MARARAPERGSVPGLYGRSVEYTCWTEEVAPESGRPLSERACARIRERAGAFGRWTRRYLGPDCASSDPRTLDAVWSAWLEDRDPARPALEDTVNVLAAAFGSFLAAELGMHWVQVEDASGSALCVRSADGRIRVCPEWVIRKRVATRGLQPFGDVYAFVRREIDRSRGLRV